MGDDSNTCEYEEAKYGFLEHLDKYLQYGEKAESYEYSNDYDNICTFTERNFVDNYNDINKICRKFEYLVNLLIIKKEETTVNESFTVQYLCYWLNDQLKKIKNNSVCAKVFNQYMKINDNKYKELNNLNDNIYDIRINEWEYMNKLINLHKKYNEINAKIAAENIKEEECVILSENCFLEYKNIDEQCSHENQNYCKMLKTFKSKYKILNLCADKLIDDKKKTLESLSISYKVCSGNCEISLYKMKSELPEEIYNPLGRNPDIPNIDKQKIIIPLISIFGISVVGFILHKFTTFGSLLHPQIKGKSRVWNNLKKEENTLSYNPAHKYENAENLWYSIAYNSVNGT
ncbi:PIR protein [Plasmodium ovale]|uniref:PIR Superfamily Protein n=2 Tax=Plasmodium ovale TaxID=36330 RepID=A0A1A8XAM0_PLAOA|nr:PIR Superfamily Protein [Plasmodium ovale curtisi]SBT01309.1 PIR Superfamily Protein [Plasmodium ovale curtisi]SBT83579.1 PIR protein [Plasmodium ovale]